MAGEADQGILMSTLGAIIEKVQLQKKHAERGGHDTSCVETILKFYTKLSTKLATEYAERNRTNCDDDFM